MLLTKVILLIWYTIFKLISGLNNCFSNLNCHIIDHPQLSCQLKYPLRMFIGMKKICNEFHLLPMKIYNHGHITVYSTNSCKSLHCLRRLRHNRGLRKYWFITAGVVDDFENLSQQICKKMHENQSLPAITEEWRSLHCKIYIQITTNYMN